MLRISEQGLETLLALTFFALVIVAVWLTV